MSMFKIEELAGSLIKQGRFKDALPVVGHELSLAIAHSVISRREYFGPDGIMVRLGNILLNPGDTEAVQKLGDDLIYIAIRIPDYVQKA